MHSKSKKAISILFAVAILFCISPIALAAKTESIWYQDQAFGEESMEATEYIVGKEDTLTISQLATVTVTGHADREESYRTPFIRSTTNYINSGRIVVEGTLINEGTIRLNLGSSDAPQNFGTLMNKGTVINKGTIIISGGRIENYAGSTLINKGTIYVQSTYGGNSSIANRTLNSTYGSITNDGSIHILNSEGVSIRNEGGATFQNNNVITQAVEGTISGRIAGNAPVLKTVKVPKNKTDALSAIGEKIEKAYSSSPDNPYIILQQAEFNTELLYYIVEKTPDESKPLTVYFNTKGADDTLQGRLEIPIKSFVSYKAYDPDPSKPRIKELATPIKTGVMTSGDIVESEYKRFRSLDNNVNGAALYCEAPRYETEVTVHAYVDIPTKGSVKLYLYKYSKAQQKYNLIDTPVKKNKDGSIYFNTKDGGVFIVSDTKL
ncbi:hypothetical protein LJC63_03535 [Ruminococcaceae bacterium OttesenSCG-928-L11]|nr:hypothetical protein [Ruminococcaceae bacterium OttesenSCG-928-L11]